MNLSAKLVLNTNFKITVTMKKTLTSEIQPVYKKKLIK